MKFRALIAAIFAPWPAPYPPNDQDLLNMLMPPVWAPGGSMEHVLGTDSLGRDLASRLIYGARVAVIVAVVAGWGVLKLLPRVGFLT